MTRVKWESPDSAVDLWNALVSARWTIVDQVDTDGRRFLLARKNDAVHPVAALATTRERQVALLGARGLSNKNMAYELGIAQSTVSSTLRNVLARLGLRSRYELASVLRSP
jgi:DNA-binding NarL/FixJ family response regulator